MRGGGGVATDGRGLGTDGRGVGDCGAGWGRMVECRGGLAGDCEGGGRVAWRRLRLWICDDLVVGACE